MSTGDRNNFGPEHAKITTPTSNNRTQLTKYLRGLPSLDFSEKGRANVCQRLKVSVEELADVLATLQRPRRNAPSAELLGTIGIAVSQNTKHAAGGAAKW
jgi:hypothetical protein